MGNSSSDGRKSAIANPMIKATISVHGMDLPTFNDEHFAKVRKHKGVEANFLEAGGFSFDELKQAGGKGGNPMAFTKDRRFIVKELNDTDHRTLLLIAEDYAAHVTHKDGSLLCLVVAHFYHPEKKYVEGTGVWGVLCGVRV